MLNYRVFSTVALLALVSALCFGLSSCGPDASYVKIAKDYKYLAVAYQNVVPEINFPMGELIAGYEFMTDVSWETKIDNEMMVVSAAGKMKINGKRVLRTIYFIIDPKTKQVAKFAIALDNGNFLDDLQTPGFVQQWANLYRSYVEADSTKK